MAQNVTLLGASYPDVPSVLLPKTGGGTASFTDVTDTTATASDVMTGKLFHASDGTLSTGSMQYKMGAVRPDAELVKTVTYDKWMIEDEVLESLPAYTTTAQTIVASADVGTYSIDTSSYTYFYCVRMLAIPKYSTTSKAKGRVEWWASSSCYELVDIPPSTLHTIDGNKVYNTLKCAHSSAQTSYNLLYWSSGTAIALYSSGLYGVYMTVTAPSRSDNIVTLKSPAFNMRGNTTYYTSTFMNATTDIRYQYVIEMYRSPERSGGVNGWCGTTQWAHLIDCMDTTTWKLT